MILRFSSFESEVMNAPNGFCDLEQGPPKASNFLPSHRRNVSKVRPVFIKVHLAKLQEEIIRYFTSVEMRIAPKIFDYRHALVVS